MADNNNLRNAKKAKADEFYTQYNDIEAEMNAYYEYNHDVFRNKTILLPCDDPEWSNFTKYFAANFERFGIKKLISTSYALSAGNQTISKFEKDSNIYDPQKHENHGKVFILEKDKNDSGKIDIDDIEFNYLEGDGDFRSEEVSKLRDESDIIITNPPFSLFREFLAWIFDGKKQFSIIGNKNAISYKEVFPYIKENKMWLGPSITSGGRNFRVPNDYNLSKNFTYDSDGNKYVNIPGPRWFTNIDHGLRHEPLKLSTMEDNLKFNKKLIKKLISENYIDENGKPYYPKYDNYNALEIPQTDAIPKYYDNLMGVPITWLDKYCPEQFEIIGFFNNYKPETADFEAGQIYGEAVPVSSTKSLFRGPAINGQAKYFRIIIKKKQTEEICK